ncbi:hypothetical protein LTR05_005641 [Lithohypha guttulata]|uniref:Uncharacterized protein n=1 Tax=Lithohypha guttulata TaxID=1690604 RepID=A0AAN7SZL7_9EURO|nr:hypothetical protein LTR05_005641 [Lithohypha guttulata]
MDNYFDFDQATIPPFDLGEDLSSMLGDTTQTESNECFDALFFDKSATLPAQKTAESGTVTLKLINDREVEAVRWENDFGTDYPMFKAKTPCTLCARMGMDCYLASRGMLITGCTPCLSLYRECSFTHAKMPDGYISTFPGIAEDEQVCHGPMTQRRTAMNSFTADNVRGRKSGARFHRDAVKILKKWLSEHSDHPYPNERERDELKQLTGLKRSQISNWLANARRRGKVRPPSDPASPIIGAIDVPAQTLLNTGYENLGPMDRWKCSPPEHEPAAMSDIARAVTSPNFLPADVRPTTSLQNSLRNSRASSRKASSEDDSSDLSIMFQPPSESSLETRDSTNSSISFASSRSHRSKQSFASSQDRRRRRRAPLLHHRTNSLANSQASNGKKERNTSTAGGKERLFQCTFCTEAFSSKYDWQRHEKSLHLALERWTCCPMGPTRIDPTTGLHQCVFCPELSPTPSHLEQHNFQTCNEKTVAERTFYRKDHLRQHLRLMHNVRYDPHMDTWKSTTFEIKSRCGFCPSLFTSWQSRADHLAAHFKNGADMKDWGGGHGFEGYVERLVENAIPPYLIGYERSTMNPYRAREVRKSTLSNREVQLSPTNTGTTPNTSTVTSSTNDMSEDNGNDHDWSHCEKIEVDQITKDSNCWHRLEEELIRYVTEQGSIGIVPTDKMMQDHARVIIYGDADPWDWTMADNQIWLDAFKAEHDLMNNSRTRDCEYSNVRDVPVTAPYVIKGGLKVKNTRVPSHSGPCPTDGGVGHRNSTLSLPGIQERSCSLARASSTSQPGSSHHGSTPITPHEDLYNFNGPHGIPAPVDASAMELDFDAVDFSQLDLGAFGEMDFDDGLSSSVPVAHTGSGMHTNVPYIPASTQPSGPISFDLGFAMTHNTTQSQKPVPASVNPFHSLDNAPEMSLEDFDQLTGYVGGFR